ncbi:MULTISPECIES: sirohydrochlorin chelatase [unclassified Enterococcus]|uniref:sirohydrochlorin chelatase n=1 Tax=unclassified Enterococcus TaxID=2608891 RepID=UPI001CE0463A|nr:MULTISPECIES: sirohydrochlorin chelatase [unclassified Enterococcus]MCA5013988.1 sirohydrochlorin chelatase [Enterococcus sp. S23]MCA5017238.1 sirohydrochlorin chelatase [Enterococcus sp. S22(2020)]
MIGILYVFHGSQKNEKNQAAMTFIQQLQEKLPTNLVQKTAFLENHPDTIAVIAERLIESGVEKIIVVPVLLFAAKHALVDIPAELAHVKKAYPTVQFIQTETFGSKKGSRAVLLERFKAVCEEQPNDEMIGFLVAHGTKKTEEPQQILVEIASEIEQQVGYPITAVSLKGQENYLEIIGEQLDKERKPVIVPFFLFDGHLITIMKNKLAEVFPTTSFIITPTLEFDFRILSDLEEIVREALACIQ